MALLHSSVKFLIKSTENVNISVCIFCRYHGKNCLKWINGPFFLVVHYFHARPPYIFDAYKEGGSQSVPSLYAPGHWPHFKFQYNLSHCMLQGPSLPFTVYIIINGPLQTNSYCGTWRKYPLINSTICPWSKVRMDIRYTFSTECPC